VELLCQLVKRHQGFLSNIDREISMGYFVCSARGNDWYTAPFRHPGAKPGSIVVQVSVVAA
jgi:hypothetical protein